MSEFRIPKGKTLADLEKQGMCHGCTPKEKETLDFIRRYMEEHDGTSPSCREIGGGKLTGSLHTRLERLRLKGHITWLRGSNRSIRLLDPLRETFYQTALEYARCPSREGFDALQDAYAELSPS